MRCLAGDSVLKRRKDAFSLLYQFLGDVSQQRSFYPSFLPFLGQDLSAEQLVHLMDKAGVDRVMLCAWHRPGKWVVSNDAIAAFVRQFPERFVGVAAVNLEKPVEAVHEMERGVKELGFKALRVVPSPWNQPPKRKFYFPLYV